MNPVMIMWLAGSLNVFATFKLLGSFGWHTHH